MEALALMKEQHVEAVRAFPGGKKPDVSQTEAERAIMLTPSDITKWCV